MKIEEQWERDAALAALADRIEHLRNETRAAYAVWNRLTEQLHRLEIEQARWERELAFAQGEKTPVTSAR